MNRPVTTLFMLMSVDGKISTGAADDLDVDRDFPQIPGLREGLHQYYEIEQTTDLWALNSGRVQAKLGVNTKEMPDKTPVSFVIIDNHHLNENGKIIFSGIDYLQLPKIEKALEENNFVIKMKMQEGRWIGLLIARKPN